MIIEIGLFENNEAIPLSHEYDPVVEQLDFEDQTFISPIKLAGKAWKEGNALFVKGSITAIVERECSRCLTKVQQNVHESLDLVFTPVPHPVLDITSDVREQLIFNHPFRFICQDECEGICQQCGSNKNIQSCNCNEMVTDSPFELLKSRGS